LTAIHCKLSRIYRNRAQKLKLSLMLHSFTEATLQNTRRTSKVDRRGKIFTLHTYARMQLRHSLALALYLHTLYFYLRRDSKYLRQTCLSFPIYICTFSFEYSLKRHTYVFYTITTDLFTFRNGFISQYFALIATYR